MGTNSQQQQREKLHTRSAGSDAVSMDNKTQQVNTNASFTPVENVLPLK